MSRKAALPEVPSFARAADRNIRVIRYSDVLLMHAEAAYHTNKEDESRNMIEMVRERARNSTYCMGYAEGKKDYSAAPADADAILPRVTATGNDLLNAIWQERRVELAMEGHRFYDLVRTGRFLDNMTNEKETQRRSGGTYDGVYSDAINQYFVGVRANLTAHSYDGANGNKVYVLPIPLKEVQGYGLEQNLGY